MGLHGLALDLVCPAATGRLRPPRWTLPGDPARPVPRRRASSCWPRSASTATSYRYRVMQ